MSQAEQNESAYYKEGKYDLGEAAFDGYAHWRDMAVDEVESGECVETYAMRFLWITRAEEINRKETGIVSLQDLVEAMGKAMHYGARQENPNAWNYLRSGLKSMYSEIGMQFIPPEGYGTSSFHSLYIAMLNKARDRAWQLHNKQMLLNAQVAKRHRECPIENADASISGTAAEADYPDEAKEQGAVGTTQVKVSLDSSGGECYRL